MAWKMVAYSTALNDCCSGENDTKVTNSYVVSYLCQITTWGYKINLGKRVITNRVFSKCFVSSQPFKPNKITKTTLLSFIFECIPLYIYFHCLFGNIKVMFIILHI